MPTTTIPQDVKDKIDVRAHHENIFSEGAICEKDFISAAEFGYSLAIPEIEQLREENRKMRELLERAASDLGKIFKRSLLSEEITSFLKP